MSRPRLPLSPDDGIFDLTGAPPTWIWVHTCPASKCDCRTALVIATGAGRQALIECGAPVHEAWSARMNYHTAAAALDEVVGFGLDIDTAQILDVHSSEPLPLPLPPEIAVVAEQLGGDVLDKIAQLWHRGKGLEPPELQALEAEKVKIHGWEPGRLIGWNDLGPSGRRDFYVIDEQLYEADELYCPTPGCDCGEVVVYFEKQEQSDASEVGGVSISKPSSAKLKPARREDRSRLEQLWAAYRRRHPDYTARFAKRYPLIKRAGDRFAPKAATVRVPAKIGRNDPCPCGSGRKYKKCCAAQAGPWETGRV